MVNNRVTGKILNRDNNPVSNVLVQVYDLDHVTIVGFPIRTLLGVECTDSNGCFSVKYDDEDYARLKVNFKLLGGQYVDEDTQLSIREEPPNIIYDPCFPDIFIRVFYRGASYELTELCENVEQDTLELGSLNINNPSHLTTSTPWSTTLKEWLDRLVSSLPIEEIPEGLVEAINSIGDYTADSLEGLANAIEIIGDSPLGETNSGVLRDIARAIRNIAEVVSDEMRDDIDRYFDQYLNRFWLEHALVGDWVDRRVESTEQTDVTVFNHCAIERPDGFTDSGKKYWLRLNDEGQIQYTEQPPRSWNARLGCLPFFFNRFLPWVLDFDNWIDLKFPLNKNAMPLSNAEPWAVSYSRERNKPAKKYSPPPFDMIAVDGNRIFVKEKGSAISG